MLITFSSKADMDVLMLDKDARLVLVAAGKITGPEIPERGVFTVEQLDDALTNLQHAIHQESATLQKHPDDLDDDEEDDNRPRDKRVVLLAQRASPLMQMMRKSKAAQTTVMWETSSGW